MLYYAHKSNLHLHKSKCELAQVYQKANDNNYTSPALEQKFAQDQRFEILLPKWTRIKIFKKILFHIFLEVWIHVPLKQTPPSQRESAKWRSVNAPDDENSRYLSIRKEEGPKEDGRAKEEKDTHHIYSLPGLFQLSLWPETNVL